jgi:uncharacterized protein HemX
MDKKQFEELQKQIEELQKQIARLDIVTDVIKERAIQWDRATAELSLEIDGLAKALGFIWREGGHWEKEDE